MPRVSLRLVLVLVAILAGWCLVPPAAASSEDGDSEKAGKKKPGTAELQAGDMGSTVTSSQPVDADLLRNFKVDYNNAGGNERAVFAKYIEALGAAAMLDALEETFSRCHHQAYDLGAVLYSSTRDLATSLEVCGRRCTGACMHGVIREAFGSKSPAEVQGELHSFCEGDLMSGLHRKGNCAHALGHAAMVVSGQDLAKSLEACSAHPDAAMGYYCATGVYMEYFTDPEELDLEVLLNLHYPCDKQTPYPAACYRYKSPLMLRALKGDGAALTKECLGLSGARRRGCFHGLGIAHLPLVFDHPAKLAQVCGLGSRDERILCIEGVVEKLADYDEDVARRSCSSLDGELAKVCNTAAAEKMYRLEKPSLPLYLER